MSNEDGRFTLADLREDTEGFMRGLRLPRMQQPDGMGEDYRFPSSASLHALPGHELGTLQLKLTGWYSYLLDQISALEADVIAFEGIYELKVGLGIMEQKGLQRDAKGVINVSVLKALAVSADPQLRSMTRQLLALQMKMKRLEGQLKIYDVQLRHLSREQTRRDAEANAR